ncbi:MAG: DUF1800 domain-containing protein [Planctomycetes bacterium]|nr:DUF1800 domain-containing protein [Planctomycetota bacterium]
MTALVREDLEHLLRHAGFGEDERTIERYWMKRFATREAAIDALVDYRANVKGLKSADSSTDLELEWLDRMAASKSPLEEKLQLFWHSHFATQAEGAGVTIYSLVQQWSAIRALARGDFQALVMAVAKSPATIRFLDNESNRAGAPNENFAREVMELYTVGIHGGYTQDDVVSAARAFTGWRREGDMYRDAVFAFRDRDHDTDPKSFGALFGDQTIPNMGLGDGEWVIQRLTETRACAEFLAQKLWQFFGYPMPSYDPAHPPAHVQDLANVYLASGRSVAEVLRALFNHPEFWSETARRSTIKSPVELYVGMRRMLRPKVSQKKIIWEITGLLRGMGQSLFNPPTVAGWDGHLHWITTASLALRYRLANRIATGRESDLSFDVLKLFRKFEAPAAPRFSEAVVERVLRLLQLDRVAAAQRQAMADYLDTPTGSGPSTPGTLQPGSFSLVEITEEVEAKLRGVFYLALALPEYQLA